MSAMVNIYAELVNSGRRTLDEVPEGIREQVREYLQAD